MAQRLLFIFAGTIAVILSACVPSYVPNTVNAPLFTNKGEIQAAIYQGSAGIDPQVSYAISNHIGIMVNGSFASRDSDSTENFHKHRFVELGSGYYNRFGNDDKGVFEIYGGVGFGDLEALYESGVFFDYAKVNMTRIFIQPSIGVTNDVFDGAFTPRIVAVNMSQGSRSETGIFWEPTFTGKVGYKFMRFVFQFGLSLPVNDNDFTFGYQPFIISLGVQGIFRRKYKSDEIEDN